MKAFPSLLLAPFVLTLPASGVTLGAVEDFSGGVGGWEEGNPSPNPPAINVGGGPDGTDYLVNVSSGSGGSGSRLAMFNGASIWTGDYLAINANALSLSAKNSGGSSVINLRVAFNGAGGWFASQPFTLTADDMWNSVLFDLTEAAMTYVSGGTGSYTDTMSNVSQMEILSASGSLVVGGGGGGIIRGDSIAATLGIDNISAVNIPEPSTTALLALLGLGALRRRR